MSRQVGSAHVEFSARTAKVVTGMEEAKRATRAAAREMKADIQEAKASIALLGEEVGVKLPRHLRSFVAELPGVASAMAAAFNGAAIIGLGMIAVEQAKKIYEFFSALQELGEKTNEEFEKLHKTTASTTDELIKTNAELANTIAKFEGRKENKLAVQLAEAASAAAALAKQLQAVDEQEMKIFGDEGVSWVKGKAAGMLPTGDLLDHVKQYNKERAEIEDEATEKIRKARAANDEDAASEAEGERDKQLSIKHTQEMAWAKKTMTDLQKLQAEHAGATAAGEALRLGKLGAGAFADPTQAILLLNKHMKVLNDATSLEDELAQNAALHIKQMGETGLSAAELAKKAAEEAAKALREQLKLEAERLKFRDEMVKKFKQGEEEDRVELQTTADLGAKLAEQIAKDAAAAQKQKADIVGATQKTIRTDADDTFQEQSETEALAVEMAQETNAQRIANLQNAAKERLSIIQDSLDEEAKAYSGNAEKQEAIDQERLKAVAEYNKETAALQREALESGIGGAMLEMERRAMDTASTIREVFTSMVSGINDQLANIMTGKRVTSRDWSNMFGGVASQAAHAGLSTAEGFAMKALGIGGKPDGSTSGKAIWTRSADNIKKAGSDIANLAKGSPDPSTATMTGIGGWIQSHLSGGGFFGTLLSALIPHASGGPVIPGGAYLVGERGPEPFFPGISGSVGTNAAMRRAFASGNVTHSVNVDARGSHDPAAVTAAVHRAMISYMPTMVTASAAFQQDMKRRTPALGGA